MDQTDLLFQYQRIVQEHLDILTPQLVRELTVIAQAQQPSETYLLDFEVHSDGFTREFPVYWDPMSARLDQLDGRTELLPTIAYVLPDEAVNAVIYDEAGINTWDTAFQMLVV